MAKNTGRGSRIAAERGRPDQFREAKEHGGDFGWASRRRRRRLLAIATAWRRR